MRGPEEWPSCWGNPADRIRLTGPAANIFASSFDFTSFPQDFASTPPLSSCPLPGSTYGSSSIILIFTSITGILKGELLAGGNPIPACQEVR